MPRNVDVYLFRQWSPLLKAGMWKFGRFGFPFGLLFPLAVLGLLSHWRKWPGVVWLFILLYPAAVILVFVTSRYRVPITGIAAVLAAAGTLSLKDIIRTRQWLMFAAVAAACAVSWGAGQFYEEKLDYEPELYYGLGDSRDKHGDTMAGIEAYKKSVELRCDYVEAQHNLGLLLFDIGQPEEAVKHYLIALKSDPNNAGIHDDLGMVYVAAGRPREAIEEYKKAIALDPENSRPYDNMGTAMLNVNKPEEAISYYKKAAEISPDDPITHNNLGNVYALTGNLQEAVKHYQISLKSSPDEADTLCNMANALSGLKRYKEAEDAYRRSIEIDPENPGTYVNLGLCLESQKKLDLARAQYQAALKIDPNHKTAKTALQRIAAAQ
jgi:tetratricopeptide (TPR) repeat protein